MKPQTVIHNNIELENINKVVFSIIEKNLTTCPYFFLKGQIGAGKTTLTKAIMQNLCMGAFLGSPTFNYINEYSFKDESKVFYHIDLYRITGKDDFFSLGLTDLIKKEKGVFFIENAEPYIELLNLPTYFVIEIEDLGENIRNFIISYYNIKG